MCVAMGTRMGPNYDNICRLCRAEEKIFAHVPGPIPELYGRYNDDCIGATSLNRQKLMNFISFADTFHPPLDAISNTSVCSLDISKIHNAHLCLLQTK